MLAQLADALLLLGTWRWTPIMRNGMKV